MNFVKSESLLEALGAHKTWINLIESYCHPKLINSFCELHLGKQGLYPIIGGADNHKDQNENKIDSDDELFSFKNIVNPNDSHLAAFNWLMHLGDGTNSNFEISKRSKLSISLVNEAIAAMFQKGLLEIK